MPDFIYRFVGDLPFRATDGEDLSWIELTIAQRKIVIGFDGYTQMGTQREYIYGSSIIAGVPSEPSPWWGKRPTGTPQTLGEFLAEVIDEARRIAMRPIDVPTPVITPPPVAEKPAEGPWTIGFPGAYGFARGEGVGWPLVGYMHAPRPREIYLHGVIVDKISFYFRNPGIRLHLHRQVAAGWGPDDRTQVFNAEPVTMPREFLVAAMGRPYGGGTLAEEVDGAIAEAIAAYFSGTVEAGGPAGLTVTLAYNLPARLQDHPDYGKRADLAYVVRDGVLVRVNPPEAEGAAPEPWQLAPAERQGHGVPGTQEERAAPPIGMDGKPIKGAADVRGARK